MPVMLASHAMGTRFELVLDGDDCDRLRVAGEAALAEVRFWHDRLNLFDRGSLLNAINTRAARVAVSLDELTFELLGLCQRVYEASGGAFDPTVRPIMERWGFQVEHRAVAPADVSPPVHGMRHVELDPVAQSVRFTRRGLVLDLGGVAKGFAIDRAVEVLQEAGVRCALLHGGTSTVAAIGSPPGRDGWSVATRMPPSPRHHGPAAPVVRLRDAAMSVSAPHGRTIERDGEAAGHLIDPRAGRPAAVGKFAAVLGETAAETDAWSTAVAVLGRPPERMPRSLTVAWVGCEGELSVVGPYASSIDHPGLNNSGNPMMEATWA